MNKFKRVTNVRLPYDLRSKDPGKNYGIHALDIWFILIGPKGAVQYAVTFNTYLPHIEKPKFNDNDIQGFDVGYHSPSPMYEGQTSIECEHLEEGKCFYDGSGLRAEEWTDEIFSARGVRPEKILWQKLEDEYRERFGSE